MFTSGSLLFVVSCRWQGGFDVFFNKSIRKLYEKYLSYDSKLMIRIWLISSFK